METGDRRAVEAFAEILAAYPGDALAKLHHARVCDGQLNARLVFREK